MILFDLDAYSARREGARAGEQARISNCPLAAAIPLPALHLPYHRYSSRSSPLPLGLVKIPACKIGGPGTQHLHQVREPRTGRRAIEGPNWACNLYSGLGCSA
jgi:hypothetical protein